MCRACYHTCMLRRESISGGLVGLGAMSLIAGLGILATDVSQADHRFGWAMIVAGAMAMLVGAVTYLLVSDRDVRQPWPAAHRNRGELANAGNVISHQQLGGQTGNLILNLGDPSAVQTQVSVLEFGEPFSETIGIYRDGVTLVARALIWRVPLRNVVEGSKATNVTPQLARSTPVLPVLPVGLHQYHDDNAPYRCTHDIRHGEPIFLDVIAKIVDADEFVLWRCDLPQPQYSFIYQMSGPEKAVVLPAIRGSGLILTLSAVPDPPAKFAEQSYRVFLDSRGEFRMTKL